MTEDELILTAVLDCDRTALYTQPVKLSPEQEEYVKAIKERRAKGEPLQYILGFTEFMGLRFFVDRRVLIPRPETEILVEEAVAAARLMKPGGPLKTGGPLRVFDIGSGSGVIAISLAKLLPECRVTALDVSPETLDVVKGNAHLNAVTDRIECVQADILEFIKRAGEQRFDLIVSNPPYIPTAQIDTLSPEVRDEPRVALDGGTDGLDFYRALIPAAKQLLNAGGCILLEIGADQRTSLEKLCSETGGFDRIEFKKDLSDRDRILILS